MLIRIYHHTNTLDTAGLKSLCTAFAATLSILPEIVSCSVINENKLQDELSTAFLISEWASDARNSARTGAPNRSAELSTRSTSQRSLKDLAVELTPAYHSLNGLIVQFSIDPLWGVTPAAEEADWRGEALDTPNIISSLQNIYGRPEKTAGLNVTNLLVLYREGICGNHRCELSELVRAPTFWTLLVGRRVL
jgi:hypothetical protein